MDFQPSLSKSQFMFIPLGPHPALPAFSFQPASSLPNLASFIHTNWLMHHNIHPAEKNQKNKNKKMPPKLHKYQFPIFTLDAILLEMAPRGTLSHISFLVLMLNPHTVLQISNIIRQITLKCGTGFQGRNAPPDYADCLQKKKRSKIYGANVGPCTIHLLLCKSTSTFYAKISQKILLTSPHAARII